MITTRKRSNSRSKRSKEKIINFYEILFRNEDFAQQNKDEEFWNDFFTCSPNLEHLEGEIVKFQNANLEQFGPLKSNFNLLITQCINTLDSDNGKKIRNSFHTLNIIFYSIFKKLPNESGFEFLNSIFTSAELDEKLRTLISRCNVFLTSDVVERDVCLKFLLIFLTCVENLNENSLVEYLMINSLFDSLVLILSDPTLRGDLGHDVVVLIALLLNYRKYEGTNPYVVNLSILADELALNGYGQVISSSLIDFCRQYSLNLTEVQSASWFTSLSNIVGNMFISDELSDKTQIRANNALLLALYEAIHLNRNFVTTLAHTQAESSSSSPPSPSNTLSSAQVPDLTSAPILDVTQYPTNLFVAVFQYCSIVMQDHKNESSLTNLKLSLLILTIISEDQYANSMMHDMNLSFKVLLHRAHMRHRKLPVQICKPRPLAATLLDLLVEFIVSHLMKKFPMQLYLLCIGIIHRLIVYQKRCRVRLNFEWKNLWSSLISLLKFLVYQEQHLIKKCNIFHLAIQVINIFNLFITYGDTFLATTNSYDELYYELNREEKVFSELHAMVLRYSMNDPVNEKTTQYKEDVLKLLNSLVNILTIIKHFQIKIKEWLASQSLSTPTEDQILEVVRKNYDLTLKLQDSLDQYDRYVEKPNYSSFFSGIVKDVIVDTKKSLYNSIKDLQSAEFNVNNANNH